MKVFAALLLLSVAAIGTSAEQVTCQDTIQCPCGSTGKNVTVFVQKEKEDICSRFSNCLTCQDHLNKCLNCPDGLEGPSCTTVTGQVLSRQKRQYYRIYPRRPQSGTYQQRPNQGYPTRPVQSGGGFCPDLNSPKLGNIRCLTNEQQKTCVGRCLPGYSFEGRRSEYEITLTCTAGYFTPLKEFPPCKSGGHCDLIVQGAGSFNCTTGMEGTRCDVICDGRYFGRYFCYPGQSWEPHLPHCMRPKVVETCHCEYGGSCDAHGHCICPEGRTGSFCEIIVPEKQTCSDPGFITNGFRRNTDESVSSKRRIFDEGETVVYGCMSDEYALQGSSLLTCRSDGTWSHPLPKCIKAVAVQNICRDPGFVTNGFRRNPDESDASARRMFAEGESVVYGCTSEQYALQGSSLLTCKRDGTWSKPLPKCITTASTDRATTLCREPGVDPNGSRTPRSPPNRRGFPPGSKLDYSCNVGYDLNGETSIFCLTSGKWSSAIPKCTAEAREPEDTIYCLNPGTFSNGNVVYHPPLSERRRGQPQVTIDDPEFPEGGRLQYTCNNGFTLEGSSSITCQADEEWSASQPICRRVSPDRSLIFCRDPGVDANGRRNPRSPPNRQGFPQGSRVEYFCNQGYELDGEKSVFCLTSGQWSNGRPRCRAQSRTPPETSRMRYCPNPGSISNGKRIYFPALNNRQRVLPESAIDDPEFPQGGRMHYFCDSGYSLIGSEALTCQPDGDWSAERPVCMAASSLKYCDNPGPITNGKVLLLQNLNERRQRPPVSDNDNEYVELPQGSRLQYSCDNGYTLRGTAIITCSESGRWSAEPPVCITSDVRNIPYCVNPGPVLNGKIRFYHPEARPRTGSTTLVSEDTPEYPEGTKLEYFCDDGFFPEGAISLKCQSSGIWSDLPPKCRADCGLSIMGTTRRLLHANKTTAGEWPWVVAIAVRQNNYSRVICGGAVLNTQMVITAAHCLLDASRYALYFGKYHRRDNLDDSNVQFRMSDRLILHPDFNNVTYDSDIALITFKPKINLTDRVQPICLPSAESTALNLVSGRRGYVTGWGYTERRLGADELLVAHLPYVSNSDCLQSFRENVPNFEPVLTQNMFCAGYYYANQSTCRGDSGSPFVFYDTLTERYTLEGLVSFGVEGQCGLPGRYSVFTKVFRFVPWIYQNL